MFLIIFLLTAVLSPPPHPIHISVSDVEISSGAITWTSRIYKDDLLRGLYGDNINMDRLDNREKIEKDILNYLTKNISVNLKGKSLKWSLQSIDSDPEALWITLSTYTDQELTTITVFNRILFEIYDDQKNIVNFTWNTGKKNIIFEKGKDRKELSLQ